MKFVFSTENGFPYLTFLPTNSNDRSVLGVVIGRLDGPADGHRYKGETVSFEISNILANCPMTVDWVPPPLNPESDPGEKAPDTPPPAGEESPEEFAA